MPRRLIFYGDRYLFLWRFPFLSLTSLDNLFFTVITDDPKFWSFLMLAQSTSTGVDSLPLSEDVDSHPEV